MANKYSDIVTLRESKPAYNIQNEEKGEWNVFIANEQFNGILSKVISSVYNNEKDAHKSFWIEGTYGTGKSHAGAVIKHLLCDDVADITEYINEEYSDAKYYVLKERLFDLRSKKRLFPVMLYGKSSIAHEGDLSLQIQKAVKSSLKNAGISIIVKTDFDNYVSHIESQPDFWDMLISQNAKLESATPTRQKLANDLKSGDTGTLGIVKQALREGKYDIRLDNAKLSDWFFEVQDKLAETTEYDGLFVIWDEFTDVMASEIGLKLLVDLQEITERAMESLNNSYFLFISHPSALNSLKVEERDKTKGRYHYMRYNMEPVSAFKIMSRKFKKVGEDMEYTNLVNEFYNCHEELLDIYAKSSNNPIETKEDIKALFPVHPSTANLATYYAREAGSSSRSVFQFLGDNIQIKEFFNNEEIFAKKNTITADYLWNYVVDEFNDNVSKYGAVTERYNSFRLTIENKGADYMAVFKGILLLNALNNIANNDTVTPSVENINSLFIGTPIEENLEMILEWLNENGIIQKSPSGIFSIQFSALPTKEIEEIKQQVSSTQFKFTAQILNFGSIATDEFNKFYANVARAFSFKLYSIEANEYTLLNKVENGRKTAKSYEIFMAIMLGRNAQELNGLKEIAIRASKEERFRNVVFFVFDSVFEDKNYERFIEYQANATCAQRHGFADQQQSHLKCANDMIKEWLKEVRRGNATYCFSDLDGEYYESVCASTKLATTVNTVIASNLFKYGPESLDIIKINYSKTYWKKASVRDTVKNVLLFNTKDDISSHCNGPAKHVQYLLQDSVDENLEWKTDIDTNHPLYKVCEFVNKKIKNADKSNDFNLAEKFEDLTKAPYGLYQSYAGMAMLAFAMRPYVNKIFDQTGKPREAQHLIEDVVEVFKCWEDGKSTNKVNFMFETPEAGKLCKSFITIFKLDTLKEYSDISSLKDARWAITHEYSKMRGYPLWSLKYYEGVLHNSVCESMLPEGMTELIENILTICSEVGHKNPSLLSNTIEGIKVLNFNLRNLLNTKDSFEIGFDNYLKSIEIVNLQDDELADAKSYIKGHLQGAIGLWNESEVDNALKNWRISTTAQPVQPQKVNPQDLNPNTPPSYVPPTPANKSKIDDAKRRIRSINNIDDAKSILERLCELGYDEILDLINE